MLKLSGLSAFFLVVVFAGVAPIRAAQPVFAVTPAAVSNTYNGWLTLQISNVPTGDTVVVQKFLDANTNGVVDAFDPLVQQFNLTDGQAGLVIGNVTNYNVPGDLNSATGAVTAPLYFQNGDISQNLIGKYLYVLSSPSGHFTPETNSFTVTNFPFAQKFTGNVVSNGTSTTLSNATVILFPPPRPGHQGLGQPLAGTVANSAGAYTIAMPAGTYTLVAFHPNYAVNLQTLPLVTLGSGLTISTNLSLTNATASISGTVVDAANSAITLPGIFMPLNSTNNLLTSFFSTSNGTFSVQVPASEWSIGQDDAGLIVHGYVGYNQNGVTTNSGAVNVQLPFSKANAMFYGTVKDNLGNPFVGIDLNDSDTVSNLYSMDGYTDANGNYFVGALGLGSSDPWQINVSGESTSLLTNYVISQPQLGQNGNTNLSPGAAVQLNFTLILATNIISGTVKDTGNNPIANVQVYAYANIGGVSYQTEVNTDSNGNYALNVVSFNTWSVNVFCGGGQNSLPGNYQCPNSITVAMGNSNVVTNFVVQSCNGIQVLTTNLPNGVVSNYYSTQLQAASCSGGFAWSMNSGALPPGLTLYSGGALNGTPTTNGTFNFTVHVVDSGSNSANQPLSLTIASNSVPPPPVGVAAASTGGQIVVYYPQSGSNYVLYTTTNLSTGPWVPATNGTPVISIVFSNAAPAQFYRLQ